MKPPRLPVPVALGLSAGLLALPLGLSENAFLARAVLTGYAISLAMKLRLLHRQEADPAMLATLPRLLVWLAIPQATFWPRSPEDVVVARRAAPAQLLRAAVQVALMLALVAAKLGLDVAARGWLALTAVEMLEFFLLLAGLADGLTGLAGLRGIRAEPVFVQPAMARSPAEFWSRRWNLVVHRFARRHLFVPLARRWGPRTALLATFAASGLMHEYLALASVGLPRYRPGFMTAFFVLQAVAALTVGGLRRWRPAWAPPAPVAIAAHLAWLLATAWLFFHPLRPQIDAFDQTCVKLPPFASLELRK